MKKKANHENVQEVTVLAKYRRTMGREKDPAFKAIIQKILFMRNSGMKATNIAQTLHVGREIVYNHTCAFPGYGSAEEIGQVVLAARSLGLNPADYILLCHASWGVNYVKKNGDPGLYQDMLQVAAGMDFVG